MVRKRFSVPETDSVFAAQAFFVVCFFFSSVSSANSSLGSCDLGFQAVFTPFASL